MVSIGVFGAGTWGMALARMLCNCGYDVVVWSALRSEIEEYSGTRRHPNLPGMVIPDELKFTEDIEEVCRDKDVLLFVIPSVFVRSVAEQARPFIPDGQVIVEAAKGLEKGTFMTMSEVIKDELIKDGKHDHIKMVAISGPTHAEEVALDLPTTIVSACDDHDTAKYIQDIFMNTCMRVYTNVDPHGIELCGALKNVIALACGIASGIGLGDNAKAALITRGMAEMTRLGMKIGCMEQTFYGLAGMGDLIVTATSVHSRNNRCGNLIGQGYSVEDAVKEVGQVVEGLNALPAAMAMAEYYDVEMPITFALDKIVRGHADPKETVTELMSRDKKLEVSHEAVDRYMKTK